MGSLESKLENKIDAYCKQKANTDKLWCSCWRIDNVEHGLLNPVSIDQAECIGMLIIGGMALVLVFVVIGGVFTLLDAIPLLANTLEGVVTMVEGLITTLLGVFDNFQWITNYLFKLLKPITWFIAKLGEIYYNLDGFMQQMFPNANEKIINIAFYEGAIIFGMYTLSQIEHAFVDWKGSVGYKIYHTLDSPFRYVRNKLKDEKFLRMLFNLLTLPPQASLMLMCILISVISNIF